MVATPTHTRIVYQYRDGHNYKTDCAEVLSGCITLEAIAPFMDGEDPMFFIPAQVGLQDLQGTALDSDKDHCWHELLVVEPTDDPPPLALTAEGLLENFRTVQWDEVQHWDDLLDTRIAA